MGSQIAQFGSQMSNIQNLFGHKDGELTRLMSEVSRLQSSETRLDERLAALSAAPSAVATSVEAQMRSAQVDVVPGNLGGAVEDRVVEGPNDQHANVFQSLVEERLDSMMAAIQCLSDRLGYYEHTGMDPNSRNADGNDRAPQPPGLRIPVGPPEPPPGTVTGQRRKGVMRRNLLSKKRLKGILLRVAPFVQSQSHCPTP